MSVGGRVSRRRWDLREEPSEAEANGGNENKEYQAALGAVKETEIVRNDHGNLRGGA